MEVPVIMGPNGMLTLSSLRKSLTIDGDGGLSWDPEVSCVRDEGGIDP